MYDRIDLYEVSPSVVAVVDERFVSNVAAVIFSDFIAVIDAGKSAYAAHRLRETLEESYRRPVRYAVVTHYHVDHVAGLEAFSDVAIVGSAATALRLRDLPDWARAEMRRAAQNDPVSANGPGGEEPRLPTLVFDDSVVIAGSTDTGDKALHVHHVGGHTACSAWAYLAEDRVLLAGDLIVAGGFPFAGDETVDPEVWMSTLKGWRQLEIGQVVPGHGPVSGPEEIELQLMFLETLKSNVVEAIETGKNPDEIVVPDMVPVAAGHEWFVESTLRRWHSYYVGMRKLQPERKESQ